MGLARSLRDLSSLEGYGWGLAPNGCVGADFALWHQGAAKVLIFPVVQQFTEAFVQALQIPDGPTSDSGFKMEVLKVGIECRGGLRLEGVCSLTSVVFPWHRR